MALVGTMPLKISDIRTELQNTGTAPFSLVNAGSGSAGYTPANQNSSTNPGVFTPDLTSPYTAGEWLYYDHSAFKDCSFIGKSVLFDSRYSYHTMKVTGISGSLSLVNLRMYDIPAPPFGTTVTYDISFYNTYPFTSAGALTGTPIYTTSFAYPNSVPELQFEYVLPTSTSTIHVVSYVSVGGSGSA